MDNKQVAIIQLLDKAQLEMLRLEYKKSALQRHSSQIRKFSEYCRNNDIVFFNEKTGTEYLLNCFGVDTSDSKTKLSKEQLEARCSIRMLDDIYQFGYARKHCHHNHKGAMSYSKLLSDYLEYCKNNGHASDGTLRVKHSKLCRFLCFVEGRRIPLAAITPADISDFIVTISGYKRPTIHVFVSTLKCFMRYLYEIGYMKNDISIHIPKPKIYAEESIPETWKPEEVQKLLSAVDRTSDIGKRDYAMILLAVILGMRAGDIVSLKFKNFDWNRKTITYVQQKTNKPNTLPILPEIGDAIIDYLKNGRLESYCDNVFIKHIHPYDAIQTSAALSDVIKKYMKYAGIENKKRKAAHSLRHTLASSLLKEGVPLMTISNVLGHYSQKSTVGYTKIDLQALRKCSLSYGKKVEK